MLHNLSTKRNFIARRLFGLFGAFCVLLGIAGGLYFVLNGTIPKMFAAGGSPVVKTDRADFLQGALSGTDIDETGEIKLAKVLSDGYNSVYQAEVLTTPGLAAYLKMDGDWNDSAGSNNGTRSGTGTEFSDSKYGANAGSFNGVDDHVDIPGAVDLDLTTDLSVEAWVYLNSLKNEVILNGAGSYSLVVYSDGTISWGKGGVDEVVSRTALATGQWYHIAVTRTGGINTIYVNGALDNYGAGADFDVSAEGLVIGQSNSDPSWQFDGRIDEFAFYNSVLSVDTIRSHYGFFSENTQYQSVVANTSGLVSYWKMDGNWNDSIGSNNGTGEGSALADGVARYGSNSGTFDGVGNWVSVANPPTLGTNSFSFEWWMKMPANNPGMNVMVAGMNDFSFFFAANDQGNGTNKLAIWAGDNWNGTTGSKILSDNQWHHIAISVGNDHLDAYVDGALDVSMDTIGSISATDWDFGKFIPSGVDFFSGQLDEVAYYNVALDQQTIINHYSSLYGASGTWESPVDSNVIDLNWNGGWGDGTDGSIAFSSDIAITATSSITFRMKTAATVEDLATTDYLTLGTASAGIVFEKTKAELDALGLATGANRYAQVEVSFVQDTSLDTTPTADAFSIYYVTDDIAPETNASGIIMKKTAEVAGTMSSNDWTNDEAPYFEWTAGGDSQSGLKGYCVYLGDAASGDPALAKGLLGTSPVSTAGSNCQFIVSGTSLDFANLSLRGAPWLTSSTDPYYMNIKAIDINNNVAVDPSAQFQFRFDNAAPSNPAYFSLPGDFISSKEASFVWPIIGDNAASDANSGIAGLQYRIGNMGTWYGDMHSGLEDQDDLLANDGIYTTQEIPDFENIQEGANFIYLRTWDLAGNISATTINGTLKVNSEAPSMPLNLTVDPADAETNLYSFDWDVPETFTGQASNITYCYTVNTLPSISTCTYTERGVTSLSADAYATNPGQNTLYLVAKSESGSINYDVYASINFTYSGTAPGIPRSLDVSDVSSKATSNWKLAISWDAPVDIGAGIETYKIYQSTTDTTCSVNLGAFSEIGATAGTSYVDAGLSQQRYYYCVKACDSANNCSAPSSTTNEYPDGKYTEPAELTSSPAVSDITTKRATISWSTNRSSDSKIAYGKDSGEYFVEEPSNSEQTTDHEINLTNLSPGTTYYYRAKWTDEDGNTGTSSEKAFKTDPAPTVKDVSARNINLSGAMIDFTSRGADKVKIYYGKTTDFGGSKDVPTASSEAEYSTELTGLEDGTKYYYRLNSFDSEGDEYEGTILDFTTLPRPKISNIKVQQVMDTAQPTVLVTWESNTEISSIVSYYPEGNTGEKHDEVKADLISGVHKMVIKGLFPNTPYLLTVRGIDRVGNEATSDSYKFDTASDTRPPVIMDLNVEGSNTSLTNGSNNQNISQLVVSWNTDEPATSQVEFGEGASVAYPQKTQEDANLTYNHLVVLSGLTPSKVYHLRAVSLDKAGNSSSSVDMVAITPKESESALNLVITNLQQVFGFLNSN